jgi:hypothetical protein
MGPFASMTASDICWDGLPDFCVVYYHHVYSLSFQQVGCVGVWVGGWVVDFKDLHAA